ncbi:acyl-CoA thioesterase [Methylomicrobium sp. Wu6]|nr:acyl-CoA thioesterase [Methylomicrobium sp. Wu6]
MMEIVWHGHYAKYFEIARCALLDRIDYNYLAMRDSGYAWPIIDLRIRYVKSAVFGQNVKVRAEIAEWENRLKIEYLMTDSMTGVKLVKGHTIQVAVNMLNKEMCLESPPVLFEKLGVKAP